MGVLNNLATAAKTVGQDVMYGVRGDYKGYTKKLGERILKSNMSEVQLKDVAKNGMSKYMNDDVYKQVARDAFDKVIAGGPHKEAAEKYANNIMKKHAGAVTSMAKAFGENPNELIKGKAIAKNNLAFRAGDAIGGGFRDAYRSKVAGHDFKTALKAGFTKVNEQGGRDLRMDRIAGAAFGVSVAGRVATGGGLYRDRYGRVNVPGVPFM